MKQKKIELRDVTCSDDLMVPLAYVGFALYVGFLFGVFSTPRK